MLFPQLSITYNGWGVEGVTFFDSLQKQTLSRAGNMPV